MSNKQALVAIIVVERNSICLQIYRMIIAYLRAYRHTGRPPDIFHIIVMFCVFALNIMKNVVWLRGPIKHVFFLSSVSDQLY